jgi:transposase-like protein
MPLSRSARAKKAALKMWADGRTRSATFREKLAEPPGPNPTGLVGFALRFSDDNKCREYLLKQRWPQGFVCPKCGDSKAYVISTRNSMECSQGHQTSLTAGTIMHHSRLPLHKWFYGAWLVATLTPGISSVQFQRELEFKRNEPAFMLLHKLRTALYAPDRKKLSSHCDFEGHVDHWIEIDETYVGGEESGKEHRGRGSDTKSLVIVAVEVHKWIDKKTGEAHTKAGRIRMRVIQDASAASIMPFIHDSIVPGSKIWTDAHGGYNQAVGAGFGREITVARRDPDPLPTMGRVVTNLKRWLIGTHKGAVRSQHLQTYLNEFVYRFDRRHEPWEGFHRALGLSMVLREHPTQDALYSGKWQHRRNPSLYRRN